MKLKNFSPGPMVLFRIARKLSSFLVWAKIYPFQRTIGSCKCRRKWCQVCQNVIETDCFTSTSTGKTYKINHQSNCSEKCVIYLLTCQTRSKQYPGQTADNFRITWNNSKWNDKKFLRGHPCFQEHIFKHLNRPRQMDFWKTFQLHLLTKLTLQSLKSEKIIGFTHLRP